MAAVKSRHELPDRARIVVDLVERFGFKWEFDYEHPLPDYTRRRVQIRDEKHYVPGEQATQYREAMRRGDKFPPIVVSRDDYLLDGNTRTEAARRNGFPTIQAVILDQPYEGANASVRRRMHLLGAALNTRNGKGIDKEEIRKVVEFVAQDTGYDASKIAELLGIPERMAQAFLAERRARERAEHLGVKVNGSVTASQLRILGTAKLNDGPWRELTSLAQQSGMAPTELRPLVKTLRESGSDQKALSLLEAERQARQEQIAEFTTYGKAKSPGAQQLRVRLKFILEYEEGVPGFVEGNPTIGGKHLEQIERAIAVLGEVAGAQRQQLEEAAVAV
jgi:hypothetical protein